MSTLVTPSAKSHERVTGRWIRDIEVGSRKEWIIYYAKQAIGTPIPWLFPAFVCLIFLSRAGLEMSAWACATLTSLYILADQFSRTREFRFFRVGADFFLLGYVLVGLAGAINSDTWAAGIANLGTVRWVFLLYLLTYCWELFPGLNRIFFLLCGTACVAAGYGIWQHFSGLDLVRNTALAYAPVTEHAYFTITGFFNTPEILGTVLATVLPFPTAAFLLDDRRDNRRDVSLEKYAALACVLLLGLALLWTYRPGLWMAAGAGVVITMLMHGIQGRNQLTLLMTIVVFVGAALLISYGSVDRMLTEVQANELTRAERQRAQINTQVSLWRENTWIGVGRRAVSAVGYDPGTGNVYFQVLAQSGVIGLSFYLLFILSFLLATYRIFHEIPRTHHWHRVLIAGGLAAQVAFHIAGLYWSTTAEAIAMNLFVLLLASISYLSEHYSRGLVPDDDSL